MAEHNIVVFAGDHCGPEVSHYSRAFPPLTLDGERLILIIWQVTAEAIKVRAWYFRTAVDHV